MEEVFQALLFLIGFGSIIFLAYITTRYIGGKANKAMRGKHINIIETVNLGIDKRIHLVKVSNQYILIASSGKNVEFLTAVDIDGSENEEFEENSAGNVFDFKSFFEKYIQSYKNKKEDKNASENNDEDTIDIKKEKSFKNNLNRLKAITKVTSTQGQKDGVESTNEE